MSRGFTLSKPAIQDLEVILEYVLETGGPDAADRVASGLQMAFRKLAETPGIGHRREDLTTDDVRFSCRLVLLHPLQAEFGAIGNCPRDPWRTRPAILAGKFVSQAQAVAARRTGGPHSACPGKASIAGCPVHRAAIGGLAMMACKRPRYSGAIPHPENH